jgi:hypothetical protein
MNVLTLYFPTDVCNIIVDYADEIKPSQQIRKTIMLDDIAQLLYMQRMHRLRRPGELPCILEIARQRQNIGYCIDCEFLLLFLESDIYGMSCDCMSDSWCRQVRKIKRTTGQLLFGYHCLKN